MEKVLKNRMETGLLQWICYRNSTKGGALYFNIQLVQGTGFSWQKRLTLKALSR